MSVQAGAPVSLEISLAWDLQPPDSDQAVLARDITEDETSGWYELLAAYVK
jgi:hypothetical protein